LPGCAIRKGSDLVSEQSTRVFPVIYSFEGHPSEDGSFFLIEGTGFDQSAVRFAIPLDNIQHFIAFLLIWVGTMSVSHDGDADANKSESNGRIPIPATSIAIGHPNGNEAYIGISVGRAELIFSLPASALAPIGQSLMLAGTSNAVPS
jgi:hypothetical protein